MSRASGRFSQEEVKGMAVKRQISLLRGGRKARPSAEKGGGEQIVVAGTGTSIISSIKESSGERYEHILTAIHEEKRSSGGRCHMQWREAASCCQSNPMA